MQESGLTPELPQGVERPHSAHLKRRIFTQFPLLILAYLSPLLHPASERRDSTTHQEAIHLRQSAAFRNKIVTSKDWFRLSLTAKQIDFEAWGDFVILLLIQQRSGEWLTDWSLKMYTYQYCNDVCISSKVFFDKVHFRSYCSLQKHCKTVSLVCKRDFCFGNESCDVPVIHF